MNGSEFETALRHVVTLGCAENVDWLFEHYGKEFASLKSVEAAINDAAVLGHKQVLRTLKVRSLRLG